MNNNNHNHYYRTIIIILTLILMLIMQIKSSGEYNGKRTQRINDKKPKDETMKLLSTTKSININQHHHHHNHFTFDCNYHTISASNHRKDSNHENNTSENSKISHSTISTFTAEIGDDYDNNNNNNNQRMKNSEKNEQIITIPLSIGDRIHYKCSMIVDHLEQCEQQRQQRSSLSLIMFNEMKMKMKKSELFQNNFIIPNHCHSIRIILQWPRRIEQLNRTDNQKEAMIFENVTKTTHVTSNDIDYHSKIIDNDDVNFISDSVRTNFNNQQRIPFSSSTRMTISNRYDAWINITNFTIDHQGIYRMIFYRRKNLLLLPENIDSKNNGNSSNDNGDDDDDDDEHEIIYEHSFKLIAFKNPEKKHLLIFR
ncbi:hypothetical protein DERF_006285 [Dermatophagoides farinae]|uniref:Uncharacterized protein n=1 Tax=Dermatophagoides farinae TaxID=6954 RepID=A0A922I767_DERFA|nr:hypothetical protein DERF_006285 [Dermatophagoides farinae]